MEVNMTIEILKFGMSALVASVSAAFAVYKLLDRKLTKHEDLLMKMSNTLAEMSGKNVTLETCVLNNRRADDRTALAINVAKTEVLAEVEAVEARLEKRIERLEK